MGVSQPHPHTLAPHLNSVERDMNDLFIDLLPTPPHDSWLHLGCSSLVPLIDLTFVDYDTYPSTCIRGKGSSCRHKLIDLPHAGRDCPRGNLCGYHDH
jgi:hypothetical protein